MVVVMVLFFCEYALYCTQYIETHIWTVFLISYDL